MTTSEPATREFTFPDADSHHLIVAAEQERRPLRARRMRLVNRVSLALPLVGIAAGAWLLATGGKRRSVGLTTLGASLGLGLARWQLQRLVTESGGYVLQATLGDIELRRYPQQIWAETVVEGATWSEALNEGFRRLAAYLFGDNAAAERLTMTAPVVSSLSNTDPSQVTPCTIAFVMPGDRELASLPVPEDSRVRLRTVPARLVAALGFRGNYESRLPSLKREELMVRLADAGFLTRGSASFAGYDPPTTLPPLRRNEVLIELADF
jgi:hypothetical protein